MVFKFIGFKVYPAPPSAAQLRSVPAVVETLLWLRSQGRSGKVNIIFPVVAPQGAVMDCRCMVRCSTSNLFTTLGSSELGGR